MSSKHLGLDVINSPWAIVPDKLEEISNVYCRHLRGDKVDLDAIRLALEDSPNEELRAYEVVNGIAVIPVMGVLSKKMNMFQAISGGTSTQILQRDFLSAMDDSSVHSILLRIDSPGGSVDGTQTMMETVRDARGNGKRIYAFADGLMASAAYWIGSAADEIWSASDTTVIGSIGVIATHVDYSKADEMQGIKVTEITAGRYKAIGSETKPLSKEDKKVMQDEIDYIYSIFVNSVAENRNVDVEVVLSDMADGRIFIGQQGIDAGLADGIMPFDALISYIDNRRMSISGGTTLATIDAIAAERHGVGEENMSLPGDNGLQDSDYAFVDAEGNGHLPISDKESVIEAIEKLGELKLDAGDQKYAARRIAARARRFDINVDDFKKKWGLVKPRRESGETAIQTMLTDCHVPAELHSGIINWATSIENPNERNDAIDTILSADGVNWVSDVTGNTTITIDAEPMGDHGWSWYKLDSSAGAVNFGFESPAPPAVEEEEETEEETEKKEDTQPAASLPPTNEGDKEMLESQVREILGLSNDADIEEALKAAAKTREFVSGEGEQTVVPVLDLMLEREKVKSLQTAIAKANLELEQAKDDHRKELRRRDAKVLVDRAVAEGKITTPMRKAWADDMALNSPEQFLKVLESMPRMVTFKEKGSDEDQTVVMTAQEHFMEAVTQKRAEFKEQGKDIPPTRELHRIVASDNPDLWDEYLEETRDLSRTGGE